METGTTFTFFARIQSLGHAINGIRVLLSTQYNSRIHALATIIVILAGMYFSVSLSEWAWLTMVIVVVWVTESLNTALELLCDAASPEFHPLVKKSKDVAAGAVLISAIGSIIVGAIIFLPYLLRIADHS